MIIDGHVHVSDSEFGNVDVLLSQLDQAGIDRALCVPGGMVDVRQFSRIFSGRYQPDPEIPNHLVYQALQQHADRFFGLVCVNPNDGQNALAMLQEGFDHGCRGVKLAPIVHQFEFANPAVDEIAARCGEHGFPVYSHVLPNPGKTQADFADVARRCPNTNFIIGHMGFGPFDADSIGFACELDNFFLESSLGNYLALKEAVEQAGKAKLMFGSEFPLSHPQAELAKIRLLDHQFHDAVWRGNVLRLLHLEA